MGRTVGSSLFIAAFMLAFPCDVSTAGGVNPARPSVSRSIWAPSGFFGGGSSSFVVSRPHGFFGGGIGFVSASELLLGKAWTISGGAEFPVASSWSFVPRLHVSGTDAEGEGSVDWIRLSLDGRISQRRGGAISYQEAGFGMGVVDAPRLRTLADFSTRHEQVSFGSASFQLVGGVRTDPEMGSPSLQIEFVFASGLGAARPASLELMAGLGF